MAKKWKQRNLQTVSPCKYLDVKPHYLDYVGCAEICSFFSQYLPFIPILDPHMTPDQCYGLSPFLFWAIVFVGSRRYCADPTLLGFLSPRMNLMALQALESRVSPIQTIQGILLLCLWPVPVNTRFRDFSHVLSGAVIHLATQIGVHVMGNGQDFSRYKLAPEARNLSVFRAQLWKYCLIVCNK